MSVTAAVIIGLSTITVALSSYLLARRVKRSEEARAKLLDRDRYRDQLFRAVEAAVGELATYGNHLMAAETVNTRDDYRLRANVLTRLNLVEAVANENDQQLATAILDTYAAACRDVMRWRVRMQVAGHLASVLAEMLAGQKAVGDLVKDVQGTIAKEEAAESKRLASRGIA